MINKSRIEFIKFFVYLLPLALIFSIFVADAIVSVASLIFLLFLIVNRNFSIFNNRIIIYFIIFNFYLLFNSIITNSYSFNLDTVIFYFRFISIWFEYNYYHFLMI
jgi:hypothetical protein